MWTAPKLKAIRVPFESLCPVKSVMRFITMRRLVTYCDEPLVRHLMCSEEERLTAPLYLAISQIRK